MGLALQWLQTYSNKFIPEHRATLLVYKNNYKNISHLADKEKIAAVSCGLSAILTTMKNKLNHFCNFSRSTHFP